MGASARRGGSRLGDLVGDLVRRRPRGEPAVVIPAVVSPAAVSVAAATRMTGAGMLAGMRALVFPGGPDATAERQSGQCRPHEEGRRLLPGEENTRASSREQGCR